MQACHRPLQDQDPTYFISTIEDHIAPWKSTYSGARNFGGNVRFVLGGSGHIAGIVNPPAANKYGYWTYPGSKLPATADEFFAAPSGIRAPGGPTGGPGCWPRDSAKVPARDPLRGKLKVSKTPRAPSSRPAWTPRKSRVSNSWQQSGRGFGPFPPPLAVWPPICPRRAAARRPVVLDTNAVLSLWMFEDPALVRLRAAVKNGGRTPPLSREDCLGELARVLAYSQFAQHPSARRNRRRLPGPLRGDGTCETPACELPACLDRDDQKFLEVARDSAPRPPLTRDKLVLKLGRRPVIAARFAIYPERLQHMTAVVMKTA